MLKLLVIRSRALLMLAVFTANFYTICHCAPVIAPSPHPHSCCGNRSTTTNAGNTRPCKEDCTHTHSIKFNLLEKQTAPGIHAQPPLAAVLPVFVMPASDPLSGLSPAPLLPKEQCRKHIPPDRLAFYQRFLI